MTVAAVVLAAGMSRRLGRPKQVEMLGGQTLLARAVRVAHGAGLAPVIVVVREAASASGEEDVVVNENAAEGMASSIRVGVRRAQEAAADGVVVMSCDQVMLRSEHLQTLCAEAGRVAGSRYAGRVGIPAYFPARVFEQLLLLEGDVGAREMLRGAYAVGDEALALDVDTDEDLARAKGLLETS